MLIYHSGTPGIAGALPETLVLPQEKESSGVILYCSGNKNYKTKDGKALTPQSILGGSACVMMSFSEPRKVLERRLKQIIRHRKRNGK